MSLKRGKGLKQVGRRAQREAPEREEMRKIVLAECGGRCVARKAIPEIRCWGTYLEVHEVIDRSVRPGVQLDPDYGVALCRAHHEHVTEDATRARAQGFSFFSHDWEAAKVRAEFLRKDVWTW